ncbi:HAMP domain-containing sensor histidine kinase [Clostridium saccharobutylicum]|uniref:HAMP domain-containing sensor histidine kinase n=1 Tax=Clostridium saccharobutylicum TaxID=169679 RepID=UPI0017978DDB|nr:signal transduction histidine kinase [Clostridium saccharobutylicum]
MERVKKQKSISKIFAMYIVAFCIAAILLVLFYSASFIIGIQTGYILPANYYEQKIEKQRKTIEQTEDVKDLIPQECKYAVYDLNGNMLQGNVSEAKALDMWNIVQSDSRSSGKYFYKVIQRDNGICVVEYILNASFANPILHRYVENFEIVFYVFLFSSIAIEIIIFSKAFKRRVVKEMKILKDTTENIQMENLDFKIEYSNIVEINDVLSALDKMKLELKEALAKQWNMEETRREQIAALTHDIKTPLTIIKGNSELLGELDLKPDETEFNNNILNEIKNMESYIKSLIEIMKSEKECILEKKADKFNEIYR